MKRFFRKRGFWCFRAVLPKILTTTWQKETAQKRYSRQQSRARMNSRQKCSRKHGANMLVKLIATGCLNAKSCARKVKQLPLDASRRRCARRVRAPSSPPSILLRTKCLGWLARPRLDRVRRAIHPCENVATAFSSTRTAKSQYRMPFALLIAQRSDQYQHRRGRGFIQLPNFEEGQQEPQLR